jgi:hypothetical protein
VPIAAAMTAALLTGQLVGADPLPPPSYRQAVQEAYDIVRDAPPTDTGPALRAEAVLMSGTGQSQPEVIADLVRRPPDYQDAKDRLLALLGALDQPATTGDPALAQQRLRDVLSMHRYDALHQPPSLVDRLLGWLKDRLNELLRLLTGSAGGGPPAPLWILYAIGVIAMGSLAVYVFLSTRGRFGHAVSVSTPGGPRPPADYFAEADRLAAAGDRVGAIRALCAGVAATLAGERTWEGSPLTVREIFRRAPDSASLRPLLLPFEAAVYGGREVDEATYARAAQVAAPFRRPAEVAA